MRNEKVLLMYRNTELRVIMAEAKNYKGPYSIVKENIWPECRLEDFYMYKSQGIYHMICEDNVGGVSGRVRWGIHLFSNNGINNWKQFQPLIVYDHEIEFENDSVLHCSRRERPELLIQNQKITHLVTGVYDGENSWCQPVQLKQAIQIE